MATELKIRPAATADSARIASLSGELGYPAHAEDIERRLRDIEQNEHHAVFVAEGERNSIAGWMHVLIDVHLESGTFVEIAGLVVAGTSRRSGVGRLLVEQAEQWARQRGFHEIRVRTNITRKESHPFYLRLGYHAAKQQTVYMKKLS